MDKRPVISVEKGRIDHLLDILSFCGMLAAVGTVVLEWHTLPARIPRHFNAAGNPDAWGGRWSLVALALVAAAMFICISLLERIPHHYNYLIEITERNAPRQYKLARRFVSILKVWVIWLLVYLIIGTITVARGELMSLSMWPLIGSIAVPAVALIGYFVAAGKVTEADYPTIREIARRELDV